MKNIPIFDLKFDEDYRTRFKAGCDVIFDEGYLTNHTMVRRAETSFKIKNNSNHTLAVSNGTAAIEIALQSIDVRGKEVLLPSNTFIATYLAVKMAGGIPVIVDVEPYYFSISPDEVRKKITKNTKAIVVVHIGGHVSPSVRELVKICRDENIYLVEDAAHAHFAELDGVKAGNIGDIGCFSFHMTKVVTAGEGGMLTFKNKELHDSAYSFRQFGMDPRNPHSHVREGSNHKMTEFSGLALELDLERSTARIGKRRALAVRYQENLRGSSWKCLSDETGVIGSYYKQVVTFPKNLSTKFITGTLKGKGITLTNGVYFIPLHRQPVCEINSPNEFQVSESFSQTHICPPCFPELEERDVDRICRELLEITGEK